MIENKKCKIDYSEGCLDCPNIDHRIGTLLASAAYQAGRDFGVELYESDEQWIENNISKTSLNNNRDILWGLETASENRKRSPYFLDYKITFFEKFIDMPGIPPNVNRVLLYLNGNKRFWYRQKQLVPPYQHFFIERWMEICR